MKPKRKPVLEDFVGIFEEDFLHETDSIDRAKYCSLILNFPNLSFGMSQFYVSDFRNAIFDSLPFITFVKKEDGVGCYVLNTN